MDDGRVRITATAGDAFKLGFFGFFGALAASLALSIGLFVVVLLLGGVAKLGHQLQNATSGAAAGGPPTTSDSRIDDGSACGFAIYAVKRPKDLVRGAPPAEPLAVHPAPATIQCPVKAGALEGVLTVSIACEGAWSDCIKPTALVLGGKPVPLQ